MAVCVHCLPKTLFSLPSLIGRVEFCVLPCTCVWVFFLRQRPNNRHVLIHMQQHQLASVPTSPLRFPKFDLIFGVPPPHITRDRRRNLLPLRPRSPLSLFHTPLPARNLRCAADGLTDEGGERESFRCIRKRGRE